MSAVKTGRKAAGAAPIKLIADNRRARHHYEFLEVLEAGIVLTGPEVKSIRQGQLSLAESYCRVISSEALLLGAHIAPYEHGGYAPQDPVRQRKLLLHKRQIMRLHSRMRERGLALVPVKAYFLKGRIKLEIALAKGKKAHDKRETIKRRQMEREAQREMQQHNKR